VEVIDNRNERDEVRIKIHTGKKRQIKRMFSIVGYKVIELDRILFAGIKKDNLKSGRWRDLTKDEVASLKKLLSRVDIQKVKNF